MCVFLLHTVLKHSLLKIGHRYNPGNFKEKSNCPPNANTSSESVCTFLIKEHTHTLASVCHEIIFFDQELASIKEIFANDKIIDIMFRNKV